MLCSRGLCIKLPRTAFLIHHFSYIQTKPWSVQIQVLVCHIPPTELMDFCLSIFVTRASLPSFPSLLHYSSLQDAQSLPHFSPYRPIIPSLTLLSYHSACHFPCLTQTLRETHWCQHTGAIWPHSPPDCSCMYTLILLHTCTPMGSWRYVRRGTGAWRRDQKGMQCNVNHCPSAHNAG